MVLATAAAASCGAAQTHRPAPIGTWEIRLPDSAWQRTSAVVGGNLVMLVPDEAGLATSQAHGYDLRTGRLRWHHELPPGHDVGAYALGGDQDLVIAVADGLVIALDAAGGGQRWRTEMPLSMPVEIAAGSDGIWLLGGEPRTLTRLDRRTGAIRARREISGTLDSHLLRLPDGTVGVLALREDANERAGTRRTLALLELRRGGLSEQWSLSTTLELLPEPLRTHWLTMPDRRGELAIVDLRDGSSAPASTTGGPGAIAAGPLRVELNAWQGRALAMRELVVWDARSDAPEPLWRRSVPSSRLQLGEVWLEGDVLLVQGGSTAVAVDAWSGAPSWLRAVPVESSAAGCYVESASAEAFLLYCEGEEGPSLRALPNLLSP